ncbi:14-3-3 protein theta [Platysternon megacephalum]|uniref:14-3-3 protein theta n=1 Tax=Platysternon megacephalum TaxID=55544 RepID=A0A4D9EV01_9SAUR|nr:14-3-3 protein theta [Platysternon megacephalum]
MSLIPLGTPVFTNSLLRCYTAHTGMLYRPAFQGLTNRGSVCTIFLTLVYHTKWVPCYTISPDQLTSPTQIQSVSSPPPPFLAPLTSSIFSSQDGSSSLLSSM